MKVLKRLAKSIRSIALKRPLLFFTLVGMLLGLAFGFIDNAGYFVRWRRLSPLATTPTSIAASDVYNLYVETEDGEIFGFERDAWGNNPKPNPDTDSSISQPCTFSWPAFSPITNHPNNVKDCRKHLQLQEYTLTKIWILDDTGQLWSWEDWKDMWDIVIWLPLMMFIGSAIGFVIGSIVMWFSSDQTQDASQGATIV